MADAETYNVSCHGCGSSFDALDTPWCSCLVTERTLVCPSCLICFCKAPPAYKQKFWSAAPKLLWDRKFEEHRQDFAPVLNPEPDAVTRPLVLVVEDESVIQRVAARAIASLGYGTIQGFNGEEGLALAKRYRPELVLADALMPKMDGREMCRRIREDPDTRGAKVVVMTALYTSMRYQNEGYKTFKVDDYLTKPLDFSKLRDVLQKHLG